MARFRYVTLPFGWRPPWFPRAAGVRFIFGAFEVPLYFGATYLLLGVVAQRRFLSVDLMDRPGAIAVAVR